MSALFGVLPGVNGGLYYNSGTYNSPTWVEQLPAKDVEPESPWTFAEAQSRETPVKLYAKATVDLPVKVVMRADEANVTFSNWIGYHWGRETFVDLMILNGKVDEQGAVGVRGSYVVSLDGSPQPIDGSIYSTFSCKPTMDGLGNFPTSVLMGANNTPTFTAISYG